MLPFLLWKDMLSWNYSFYFTKKENDVRLQLSLSNSWFSCVSMENEEKISLKNSAVFLKSYFSVFFTNKIKINRLINPDTAQTKNNM